MTSVPRWVAGVHDALACSCGQVTRWSSQSMVNPVRSKPAPARAWGEVSASIGVSSRTPKLVRLDTSRSADGYPEST